MNSTLSTAPSRHDHPPEHSPDRVLHPRNRVTLPDRLALHLGIALIKWGRRSRAIETRERRANRVEVHLARVERERAFDRTAWLLLPPR
jgi:hypothetical protein